LFWFSFVSFFSAGHEPTKVINRFSSGFAGAAPGGQTMIKILLATHSINDELMSCVLLQVVIFEVELMILFHDMDAVFEAIVFFKQGKSLLNRFKF
jgi:hypothetical protein